jgi:hypothetical protein
MASGAAAAANPEPRAVLPAFLVIGAQKAGTTSLDAWLRIQRSIELPEPKETHYFSDDERYAKGLSWYLDRFGERCGGAALRGEVDPDYLSDPRAPERISAAYGGAGADLELVAVLREPIARAHSQWRMSRRRGVDERPFGEALRASLRCERSGEPADGHRDYYARGRYARHLARYRAALPDARFLAVRFEDLFGPERRAETFARLSAFVGLVGEPEAPEFDRALNRAGRSRSMRLARALQARGPVLRALGRLVPGQDVRLRIGVWLERLNTASADAEEPLSGPLPGDVLEAMRADLDALERVLGWDLASWRAALERHAGGGPA